MDISGLTLIRKLNILELALDYAIRKKYLIFVNAFLIESEYDLIDDVLKVEEAISYWKRLHPFLRCKIYAKYNDNNEADPYEKYFFYVDEETVKNQIDVIYLDFRTNIPEYDAKLRFDYWKLLFEKEFTVAVDTFYDYLWTLKIIRLNFDQITKKYNYCFLLNINHSITDHVNTYAIIDELCLYIDQAYTTNLPAQIDESFLKLYRNEFDYQNDIRNIKPIDEPFDVTNINYGYKIPDFFMPIKREQCGEIKLEDIDEKSLEGAFYLINKSKYLSVKDIINESKDLYVTKYCFAKFPSETFLKLCTKAHEHNINLTSCFSLITALALRNVYRLFSNDFNKNEKIDYSICIPLRKYLDPPLDNRIIGSWFHLLTFKFYDEYNGENSEFWTKTFWNLAQKYSLELEEKLKTNEKKKYFENLSVLFNKIVKGLKCDGFIGHFLLTYVGDLVHTVGRSNKNIYIKEHRKGLGFEKELTWSMYTNHDISCIDNTLFWDLTYSSYIMKKEVAECWIDNISEIFYKLIQ